MVSNKKAQKIEQEAFEQGYLSGKRTGEYEAYDAMIGILREQQATYGNIAGIDDLIALLTPPVAGETNV